jgi:type III restriction enzyme
VVSYAKNYLAVHFKLDYVNANGDISNYYPDFLVKLTDGRVIVVETKGQVDLDVPLKTRRLRQWCEDVNAMQNDVEFDFVYVNEEGFKKYNVKSFENLLVSFTEYKS